MKRCWADSLAGCGAISKEHIVSHSILQEMVTVQGLPWCKDKPARIPSATLKSKILCDRHNNQLSLADSEIKNFVFTVKSYCEAPTAYRSKPSLFTNLPIRYTVDGKWLERWFCKTLINVTTLNSSDAEIPIDNVLPFLFQGQPFVKPFGLNFAVKVGQSIKPQDNTISVTPVFHTEEGKPRLLIGGLFVLRSFHFVVLLPTRINPIVDNTFPLSKENTAWAGLQLNWHNQEINDTQRHEAMNVRFQVITFKWD